MGKQEGIGGGIERTSRGFTLIEVLLSLFLVALISGILFASFFMPLRAVSAAKSELVKVEEAAVFLTRLSEEISAAYGEISVADTEISSFSGTADSLSFLSSAGTDLGLEKIGYTVKKDDSVGMVTIYRKAGLSYRAEGNEQPVLQAENMVFGYYDGKEWSEEWDKKGLPLLVEVNLARKGKSFRVLCGPRAGTNPDADTGSDTGVGRS
ncbi:MAG: prepilin-type N-terminal cleavage/methylation domain-containing protein [Candidatus Ratteibacteria bacterium]|jgi:prepilin-type N-terminal cleavage/methylation domain-containing protein